MEKLRRIFNGVEDPRKSNVTRHDFHEMLTVSVLSSLCGGPTWPRRGAASALRGRIRNAENRIHASGFARGASNLKPSLDIPDRNCRNIGTLLRDRTARRWTPCRSAASPCSRSTPSSSTASATGSRRPEPRTTAGTPSSWSSADSPRTDGSKTPPTTGPWPPSSATKPAGRFVMRCEAADTSTPEPPEASPTDSSASPAE